MSEKTVLIIGGSGGIGEAILRNFASSGFKIGFTYCSNAVKAKALEQLAPDRVRGASVDFSQPETIHGPLAGLLNFLDKADSVVFTLSSPIDFTPFLSTEWKAFQTHFDIQVRGLYETVKALQPQLKSKHRTKIIVVLTEACIGKAPSRISDYLTAKYALMGLSKALAVELAPYQCTVNMVSPGMTETALLGKLPSKMFEFAAETNPMKRITKTSDVAEAVAFLASPGADYLNGVHLPVNGGGVML